MSVLAIDPGNEDSAFVIYDASSDSLLRFAKIPNDVLLAHVRSIAMEGDPWSCVQHIAIEMIASYGMPVGREVFETCLFIGRIQEASPVEHSLVYRREVKLHLCGQARAKDGNIRQALIDRYGGSREKAIGKKATPGPLYGVSADVWQALALAVTWSETRAAEQAA